MKRRVNKYIEARKRQQGGITKHQSIRETNKLGMVYDQAGNDNTAYTINWYGKKTELSLFVLLIYTLKILESSDRRGNG